MITLLRRLNRFIILNITQTTYRRRTKETKRQGTQNATEQSMIY